MDNVETIRKLEAAYSARDYETVRTLIAPNFVAHTPGSEMLPPGVDGAIASNEGAWTTFPDRKTEILDVFGAGDKVVTHIRMTGTNKGGLDWAGIPPNGKAVDTDWIQVSRHDAEGRVAETWAQMNTPKMMQQLGAKPAPEGM